MLTLEVGQSPISNPRAVASFLSDIFPTLTSITAWDNFDPDNQNEVENWNKWRETAELFHHFVAIRNEERTWSAAVGPKDEEMQLV